MSRAARAVSHLPEMRGSWDADSGLLDCDFLLALGPLEPPASIADRWAHGRLTPNVGDD